MLRLLTRPTTTWCSFSGLAVAVLLTASHVPAQAPGQRSAEVELTLQVCQSGPAALTARAERGVGAAEIGAVEPRQNPSLVFEHQQTLNGPNERETIAGAEIPLSISGRRGLLEDAAVARQRASDARASADSFEDALAFRRAFAAAVIEYERVAVVEAQQGALETLALSLKQLSARGETAAYDVRRHESEVRLHARGLASRKARAEVARTQLERWLGSAVPPTSLSSVALARDPLTLPPKSAHPDIQALRFMARAAASESDAARRRWFPEPEIFAGYRTLASGDETGHGVSLGLSLPLTFFEHGQGAAARARAERTLIEARANRLQRDLDVELQATGASLRALEASLREAELNVASTEQLKESARLLYAAGETSIAELLDAYRTAEGAALDRLAALEELLVARLTVMRAAGKQFDPKLDAGCGSHRNTNP